ncbi:hypothetical protein ABW19_dt0209360 [Dactylella cylindrospora]|nr:hypothetical protein ABW19_dt0209360 [Dactylella cylindrospora]
MNTSKPCSSVEIALETRIGGLRAFGTISDRFNVHDTELAMGFFLLHSSAPLLSKETFLDMERVHAPRSSFRFFFPFQRLDCEEGLDACNIWLTDGVALGRMGMGRSRT